MLKDAQVGKYLDAAFLNPREVFIGEKGLGWWNFAYFVPFILLAEYFYG